MNKISPTEKMADSSAKGLSIGLGSWTDSAYRGILYPPGLKPAERLKTYAEHFGHVEVNSTYYATPKAEVLNNWIAQTPDGFEFDIKLHRLLSQDPGKHELASRILDQLEPLIHARKLGVFLLMLAPFFNPERNSLNELNAIVSLLQPYGLAVELRHRGWVAPSLLKETLAYFRDHRIGWVAVDMPDVTGNGIMPFINEVTSPDLAYLRLHGRNKKGYLEAKTAEEKHHYLYKEAELKELAGIIKGMRGKAAKVRVVANNHAEDFAPRTALALKKLLKC